MLLKEIIIRTTGCLLKKKKPPPKRKLPEAIEDDYKLNLFLYLNHSSNLTRIFSS